MFFYFTDNFTNYCNHSWAEMCYYNQNNVSSLTIILFLCVFGPIFSPTSYMAVEMAMLAWKLLDCTGLLLSTEIQSLQDDKF